VHARGGSHHAHAGRHRWRRIRDFLRTPKGLLLAVLAVITVVAGRVEGPSLVAPRMAAAILAAAAIDLPILRWRRRRWMFPDGAVLTGMLVALVLAAFEPWYVFAAASAIGIAAKHLVRTRTANVFNPAALGLVAVYYLFDTGQNWWGSLTAIVPGAAWPLLAGSGVFVAHRVNKIPLVIAFLAAYFVLFAASTYVVDIREVAEVFVAPDLLAVIFFATFMLTDPPTSPTRYRAQVLFGVLVAATSVGMFIGLGAVHYLLAGVLVGNVFEAARRQYRAATAGGPAA
jgi:Na+-translocating ferredoxin:NAD+ oxidoreductase RnfD subunit